MPRRTSLILIALSLLASGALADILPTPDRGPPAGRAGDLDFAIQWVEVGIPPVSPRYHKREQAVILVSCAEGRPNCRLAHARNLIGREIYAVGDQPLRPEAGMISQIIDAFSQKPAPREVTLEFAPATTDGKPVTVAFSPR